MTNKEILCQWTEELNDDELHEFVTHLWYKHPHVRKIIRHALMAWFSL